ncbi:MFS transporter [Streptacidiphilus sp. N1-10]|uniref:MFS transporter n=1 Tax=Streptacidiphilus jeojiensis TaxID=3229225 RepID=A0ABV6Y0P8_9ACTN
MSTDQGGRAGGAAVAAAQAPLPALRSYRDFRLLWTGSAMAAMADRCAGMSFTLLVLWHTGSGGQAGLVGFAGLLPALLVQLPAGVLVDRLNRRRLSMVCIVVRTVAVGSVVAALLGDHVWVWHIAVVAFVQSSMTVFYQLSEVAMVRGLVPSRQLSAAMATNEARSRGVNFVGYPVSGALFGISAFVPFASSVGLYFLSLLTLVRMRRQPEAPARPSKARRRMRTEIAVGLSWVWSRAYFRTALLIIAGSNLVFQGLILTVAVVIREDGGATGTVGLIMAGGGLGGLCGALAGGWLNTRMPMRHIMIVAHVAWALVMPATIVLRQPVELGSLFFVTSCIGAAVTVAGMCYQVRITPDNMQGRVGSVVMLLVSGASSLGVLVTGYLVDDIGTRRTLAVVSGVMVLLAVVSAVVFTRSGAAREDQPDDVPDEPEPEHAHAGAAGVADLP